jgi:hypothetical protein
MGEFSESYHLMADDQPKGVAILERAGVAGFVFPAGNGWVTMVPGGGDLGVPNATVAAASPGSLLYYVNAEDHGWSFIVFSDGERASTYACVWDDPEVLIGDEVGIDDEHLDLEVLVRMLRRRGRDQDEAREELRRILFPEDRGALAEFYEETDGGNPGHAFAELLGLQHYSWISPHYLEVDETVRASVPGIIRVG